MPLDIAPAADATAATSSATTVHRVDCREIGFNDSGPVYRVSYNGEVLIPRAWEPITEAARVLVARGCDPNDRIELWGGEPCGRLGYVAGMTVIENASEGPRWSKYKPHPGRREE